MKSKTNDKLNAKEHEIANLLHKLNLRKDISFIIVALSSRDEMTSFELEQITNLSQPSVSNSTKLLKEDDWITIRNDKNYQGKGRPYKVYKLKLNLKQIISILEEKTTQKQQNIFKDIEKLKTSLKTRK